MALFFFEMENLTGSTFDEQIITEEVKLNLFQNLNLVMTGQSKLAEMLKLC